MTSNKWRNRALVFLIGGFFVMYCGVYSRALLPYLLAIGSIVEFFGIYLYFRFGPIRPNVHEAQCPRCGKETKLVGAQDVCKHCHQPLRRTDGGQYEPYVPAPESRP